MGDVPSHLTDGNRPVEQVSWEDAVLFCRKLSERPEERTAGRAYRLPTEAEWEYACRAGMTTRYSFGDDESQLGDHAWFNGNSGLGAPDRLALKSSRQTHPVGKKQPNGWGLFDMHGNVGEWCSDWYGDYPKGAATDPQGPSKAFERVRRGGSWNYNAPDCRSAKRGRHDASSRFSTIGLRVAMDSP